MSARVWTRIGAAWLSACVACSVGSSDDGFGMLTAQPTATTPMSGSAGSGGDDDGDDDGSGSSAGTMADDDGGSADDGDASSAADGGSTGQAATSDGSGSGGQANEQPENGMYAHCTGVPCVGTTYCITATPDDGFCTNDCESPGVSCDSMPGGTASPICLTVTQGTVCALDCSAGQTCPGGMI